MGVALLAEGVDRNCAVIAVEKLRFRSPSSRRAWIEISELRKTTHQGIVALLAEGVDRNKFAVPVRPRISVSPSSRRAWIEIPTA